VYVCVCSKEQQTVDARADAHTLVVVVGVYMVPPQVHGTT